MKYPITVSPKQLLSVSNSDSELDTLRSRLGETVVE